MSTINVKVVSVDILPHENADRLEIARIGGSGGFQCVVSLGKFKTGDLAIYIPPDAVLPDNIMEYLSKNKVSMSSNRLRAAKIRGVISEGLCLKPSEWLPEKQITLNNDVTAILNITKYEPPPPKLNVFKAAHGISINYQNDNFKEYTCVEKFKKFPHILEENEEIVATIKYHGTNFRMGYVPKPLFKKSFWTKVKEFFVGEETHEVLVGSHSRIRYPIPKYKKENKYKQDLYWRAAIKYDLENVIMQIARNEQIVNKTNGMPRVIIYGEIIGPKIQKGYDYGVSQDDIEIRVFDIFIGHKFVKWDTLKHLCLCFNLPVVDVAYEGPWNLDVLKHAEAVDEINGKKYVREGIVIKPVKERWHKECGRVIFKYLNNAYLLDKKNSEYH